MLYHRIHFYVWINIPFSLKVDCSFHVVARNASCNISSMLLANIMLLKYPEKVRLDCNSHLLTEYIYL